MSSYVLGLQDIDKTKLMVAGGKGANLVFDIRYYEDSRNF